MTSSLILIDSHVHIYDKFDIKRFFYCALKNFGKESKKLGHKCFKGVLFLTETKNEDYFSKLEKNIFENELNGLSLIKVKNNENSSIVYKTQDDNHLIIISGKQIITSENLEVLALGRTKNLDYGYTLKKSVEKINSLGALPIIPWGVGKWIGKRKEIVENFLENNGDLKYFFGDNSGRPVFWAKPGLFRIAANKGIVILRGSDPLPLNYQEEKVGKFGFYFQEELNLDNPAENINNILLNLKKSPKNFGTLENPFNFIKNQFAMQFRKLF
ncbi:MAG: hypothetical protein WAM24_22565 [Ignavibacteriaceae bacterium]